MWTPDLTVLLSQWVALCSGWLVTAAVLNPRTVGAAFIRRQSAAAMVLIAPAVGGTYLAISRAPTWLSRPDAAWQAAMLLTLAAFAGLVNAWRSRLYAARFAVDPNGAGTLRVSLGMSGLWLFLVLIYLVQVVLQGPFGEWPVPETRHAAGVAGFVASGVVAAALLFVAWLSKAAPTDPAIRPAAVQRALVVAAVALAARAAIAAGGTYLILAKPLQAGLNVSSVLATYGLALGGRWLGTVLIPAAVIAWLWRPVARGQRPGALDVIWVAIGCSLLGEWAANRLLLTMAVPI